MNFLVTGGAGFIGSHVCERLLRDGHAVWTFDDLNNFYDPQLKQRNLRDIQSLAKPFEFIHGDLTNRAALDELFGRVRFDQVIHLAGRAGVPIPVFGDGSTARDYTYITDILDGVMACTRKEFGYEIFNLGESQTVKLDWLVELLESALGKKAVIDRQPAQPGD